MLKSIRPNISVLFASMENSGRLNGPYNTVEENVHITKSLKSIVTFKNTFSIVFFVT